MKLEILETGFDNFIDLLSSVANTGPEDAKNLVSVIRAFFLFTRSTYSVNCRVLIHVQKNNNIRIVIKDQDKESGRLYTVHENLITCNENKEWVITNVER